MNSHLSVSKLTDLFLLFEDEDEERGQNFHSVVPLFPPLGLIRLSFHQRILECSSQP